jgi:hypothetical protein
MLGLGEVPSRVCSTVPVANGPTWATAQRGPARFLARQGRKPLDLDFVSWYLLSK